MRTLIFLLAFAASMSAIAQPFFTDIKTDYIQDPTGKWMKIYIFDEVKIEQPKDLEFTRDDINKMTSGNPVDKSTLLPRNWLVTVWVEFNPNKTGWFETTNHVSKQYYQMVNDRIGLYGNSFTSITPIGDPWVPWAGTGVILFLCSLYVFALKESNVRKSALCLGMLMATASLVAYLPINGFAAVGIGIVLATIMIPTLARSWDPPLFATTLFVSIILCGLTRSISEGRGKFLIFMTLCCLVLLLIGWIIQPRNRDRNPVMRRGSGINIST